MPISALKPRIFEKFPEVKTFFVIGDDGARPDDLFSDLHLPNARFVTMKQTHSARVVLVDEADNKLTRINGDGSYTREPNVCLAVRTADCLPILFYNEKVKLIGAVHAGWRGTFRQILARAMAQIQERFTTRPEDFCFYFGPAARACCYEVKEDVAESFAKIFGPSVVRRAGRLTCLDFVAANKLQLLSLGVAGEQIEDSGVCTIHNRQYPSYRRQPESRKELASLICLI